MPVKFQNAVLIDTEEQWYCLLKCQCMWNWRSYTSTL